MQVVGVATRIRAAASMPFMLRTASLWPAIITHGLWDFGTFTLSAAGGQIAGTEVAPTSLQVLLPLLLVLPNALYALWLLRHVGRTHARPED